MKIKRRVDHTPWEKEREAGRALGRRIGAVMASERRRAAAQQNIKKAIAKTPQERSAAARRAVNARWGKYVIPTL